mgnify:FL=1
MLSLATMISAVLVATAAIVCSFVGAAPVPSFPGFNEPLKSAVDSGYVTVDEQHGRRLFYVFVESQRNPLTDPLVLWLNGGPGCSSLFGFFTELGPFFMNFTANGTGLLSNPHTWTSVANIIFLESPAGVGFSTSNVTADYTTGDERTADDSYKFLQGFLAKFPQFQVNDFWVIGESYAGHYVPQLVHKILSVTSADENGAGEKSAASSPIKINLKGMMVGNPWTDPPRESLGTIENWWSRGIIGEKTYSALREHCNYRDIAHWMSGRGVVKPGPCFNALNESTGVEFGGINPIGVYLDVCNEGTVFTTDEPNWCAANQVPIYVNLPAVQDVLHVSAPVPSIWYPCPPWVNYSSEDVTHSVLDIYKHLIASSANIRVLIYSGDQDTTVPFTGTRTWLRALNLPILDDVHEWYVDTNGRQVGGWAINYGSRFTFTTVRAGAHTVPMSQPQRGLHMFKTFLEKGTL